MSDIKESILALAEKLKADMVLSEDGVVTVSEDTFEKTLPEGLDMKTVKAVQDHTANLVSATGYALGQVGIGAFKKDKRLEQVSVEFAAGKDSIGGVFQRSKEVRNPTDGSSATKYGILSMKMTVNAHANKGSLKKVRTALSNMALDALKK
jgi:hypothetical protein